MEISKLLPVFFIFLKVELIIADNGDTKCGGHGRLDSLNDAWSGYMYSSREENGLLAYYLHTLTN